MKVLLDTNVLMEALRKTEGSVQSLSVIDLCKSKRLDGWISAHSVLIMLQGQAKEEVNKLIEGLPIIPLRASFIQRLFSLDCLDFEANLQLQAAIDFNLEAIITNSPNNFTHNKIKAYTPPGFIEAWENKALEASKQIPLVDLKAQLKTIYNQVDEAITRVITNTAFIGGKQVKEFESKFAKLCQAEYGIGVNSGTDALHLALRSCGVRQGDEVITVPNTFIATTEAITMVGAKIVFVDINPQSYTIDVTKIEERITTKTKAILPVHLYGQPADMDPILDLAKKYNLIVIEDAAQAHLSEYKGKRVGSIGDVTCFSFFPGKNLGAYGDAGMITTNNPDIAQRAAMLKDHGRKEKYSHQIEGYNSRLDGLQAAVLGVKLDYLTDWTLKRREIARRYNELLTGVTGIVTPAEMQYAKHAYHLYCLRTNQRDELLAALKSQGIEAGIHYPIPLHLQEAYSYCEYKAGDFPITEAYAQQILSLPIFPELSEQGIERIVNQIKAFFEKWRGNL